MSSGSTGSKRLKAKVMLAILSHQRRNLWALACGRGTCRISCFAEALPVLEVVAGLYRGLKVLDTKCQSARPCKRSCIGGTIAGSTIGGIRERQHPRHCLVHTSAHSREDARTLDTGEERHESGFMETVCSLYTSSVAIGFFGHSSGWVTAVAEMAATRKRIEWRPVVQACKVNR